MFTEKKMQKQPIKINSVKILQPTPIPAPVETVAPPPKPTPVVQKKDPNPVKKKKKVKKKVYKNKKRKKKVSSKSRKPRIRKKRNTSEKKKVVKKIKKKITPVAGISQSTRKNPQAKNNLAVPVGNTSELAVDPNQKIVTEEELELSDTSGPQETDYEEVSVDALAVDELARCDIPEVELTEDALDEGVETGLVEVMVIIDEKGEVKKARLTKKTGFRIDELILAKAKGLKCDPAKINGKPVPVKNKKLQWVIQS